MPASQLRRVHRLHLRSSHDTLNRRGAILLEDALRTATLPDGDGSRLLLVRCLSLGRFRVSAAPASLALLIEQRVHECCARSVSAQDPSAPLASAVYFRDEVEPYISLAVRLTKQESVDAWFWPLAVRGWNSGMSRDDALRVLLAGICQTEAAWAGVLSLVRVLLRDATLNPLLSSLRRQDGPTLLALFGWASPSVPPARPSAHADADLIGLPAAWTSVAMSWFRTWGADDSRSLWLAAVLSMLAAQERGPAFSTPSTRVIREAPALIRALSAADLGSNDWADLGSGETLGPDAPGNAGRQMGARRHLPASSSETQAPPNEAYESLTVDTHAKAAANFLAEDRGVRPDQPESATDAGQRTPNIDEERSDGRLEPVTPRPLWKLVPEADCTSFGGLFFLISAMQRTGLPLWLEEHPEFAQWNFPGLLLREIARRLQAADEDPAVLALRCRPEGVPEEVSEEIRFWIMTLRRWCRRVARIGLHSLICRPGRIACTETHIDITFRAVDADIRVRKAGLDIDPGWVPWFGQVIYFHYLTGGEFDG
jgi:hypothetical protein